MRCLLNAYDCDIHVVIMFACCRHDQAFVVRIDSYTSEMIHKKATLAPSAIAGEDFSRVGPAGRTPPSVSEGSGVLLPAAAWRSTGKHLKNWKCLLENMAPPLGCPCWDAVNRGESRAARLPLLEAVRTAFSSADPIPVTLLEPSLSAGQRKACDSNQQRYVCLQDPKMARIGNSLVLS